MSVGLRLRAGLAWTGRVFTALSVIVVVVLLLFALMNYFAARELARVRAAESAPNLWDKIVDPRSPTGIALLQHIHGTADPAVASERANLVPGFEQHPGLHYMAERVANKHYRIGLEGVRYEPGWDDTTVSRLLKSKRELLFVMGGSTVMGHGVSSNETISWHLNRQLAPLGKVMAVNFGAPAYDRHRAIEKLVYLLRTGHRPRYVVFLDGWNDVALAARSNLRWQDKVVFHGFSAGRGEIAFTPGVSQVDPMRLLAQSLPIVRLLRERAAFDDARVQPARDPFVAGFDFAEAGWVFRNGDRYASLRGAEIDTELVASLRSSQAFLDGLARAFEFQLVTLLQPMGLFDIANPFVPDHARADDGYRTLLRYREAVRRDIAAGNLRMIDASDSFGGMTTDRYVDVAHYSPAANRVLAERILGHLVLGRSATAATNPRAN